MGLRSRGGCGGGGHVGRWGGGCGDKGDLEDGYALYGALDWFLALGK